jgi:tetratricopeptide (TPR) repeat protein
MKPFAAANIAHVSSTDHRVPRKALARRLDRPPGMRKGDVQELVSVFVSHKGKSDPELDRDKAVAGAVLARRGRRLLDPLDRELEEAAERDPSDLVARSMQALALVNREQCESALPLLEGVLAKEPDYEPALLGHAIACTELGKTANALVSWRRLIELFPTLAGYRSGLVELLMREGRWEEAAREAEAWLTVDPGTVEGHAMLRHIRQQLGQAGLAQAHDRIVRALTQR